MENADRLPPPIDPDPMDWSECPLAKRYPRQRLQIPKPREAVDA